MTKHKEKGTVTTIRITDKAVRRNAVNPKPSESAKKGEKSLNKIRLRSESFATNVKLSRLNFISTVRAERVLSR